MLAVVEQNHAVTCADGVDDALRRTHTGPWLDRERGRHRLGQPVAAAQRRQFDDVDRAELRELVRRGHVVARDGMHFHADTIDAAALLAARLLSASPDGFTVATFRDATGASRKFALPLVAELLAE